MEGSILYNIENEEDMFKLFVASHESQLKSIGLSENKWKTLYRKLNDSIFDAGNDFMYSQVEDDVEDEETVPRSYLRVYTKSLMEPEDQDHIYLIDHAWTYTLDSAKAVLKGNEHLVERMCSVMNLSCSNPSEDEVIENILNETWKYNNSYILQNANQTGSFTRCWFIMDEFGSRIHRSEDPTFAIAPFFFCGDKMMYSLLFPVISVTEGEEVTCAYPKFKNDQSDEMKMSIKYPWEPCDLSHIDYTQSEPDLDYFMSGRHMEILPEGVHEIPSLTHESKIRLYSEYPEVSEYLTNPRFYSTQDKTKAHILWLAERLYDYRSLADIHDELFYVSQFPSEQVLINKDLLAIVCRRSCEDLDSNVNTLESCPKWLPTTYSLMIELPQFISYFQNREKRHLDNTWICKPFNLARGLDIYITDNLSQIIRLSEIRPMVACKYITDPVLFPKENVGLVKMDLRFIVLLRSIQDFELFVYERFWLRFANKPFSLGDFEDYEKHFTVMNYSDFPLQQMFCHDFIKQFEEYYPSHKWSDIESSIYKMIKDIFIASALREPPAGIGSYPGSRAMYGLDIMLEWDRNHDEPTINPVILEVNWMPDCKRACDYYPEFFDDVFSVLFLNDINGKHVVQL
ncbi:tubulin--tyrosine ligase-like protein 12 [Nephila pilipes]|uniref:Tubulin--tyrosine ligase-like protein 12 n=1 Tax=Nephila pilipes TaxID=299642 RepID=A0A8X6TAH4_NEPPI|nr:tubulin--tyrosine ligase-like protein 12 [Nephila pilipes]